MSPVEFMDIRPGMKVLDLCAAPGGKSVQIAAKLNHEGILVSNDISLKRTKAILKNIEIQGITNALVTNADPAELADFFGVARPSLARSLSEMIEDGVIEVNKKEYKVLDMKKLKELLV